MKITNPLDNILDNEAKVRILRFLLKTRAQWNGRQIAKEVGVTPATAHKALHSLRKEGVLLLRNIGRTHVYSLNESSVIVSGMLTPLFAKEDRILDSIIGVIKRKISSLKSEKAILSVALFGSVTIRQDRPTSDIDLAVIVENAKGRAVAERLFEEIDKKIMKEFGNALSPYINTRAEFKAKYRRGMAVVKSIVKCHNLIYGKRLGALL